MVLKQKHTTKCCQGYRETGTQIQCYRTTKWPSYLKMVWKFFRKINIYLPYDSAIPLPGIYQREVKTYVYTKTYTQMFLVALFTVAKK